MNKEHAANGEKCGECANIFFSKRGLKDHMMNHSKMKNQQESVDKDNLNVKSAGDLIFYQVPVNFETGEVVINVGDIEMVDIENLAFV
jgi:hypothetical protein